MIEMKYEPVVAGGVEVIRRYVIEVAFLTDTEFPSDVYGSAKNATFKPTKACVLMSENRGRVEAIMIQVLSEWTQQTFTFDTRDTGYWYNTDVQAIIDVCEEFARKQVVGTVEA